MSSTDPISGGGPVCIRTRERFADLLDGVPAAEAEAHLSECAACRRELDALHATRALLKATAVPDGAEARDRVLRRFRLAAAKTVPAGPRLWRHSLALAAAAAAAIWMLMAGGPAGFRHSGTSPSGTQAAAVPTNSELDQMAAQHAAQSVGPMDTSSQVEQDALGDANARIETVSDEGSGR